MQFAPTINFFRKNMVKKHGEKIGRQKKLVPARFNILDFIILFSMAALIVSIFCWPAFIKAPQNTLKKYYGHYIFMTRAEYVERKDMNKIQQGDVSRNRNGIVNTEVLEVVRREPTYLYLLTEDGRKIRYEHPAFGTVVLKLKVLYFKVFDEAYPDSGGLPDLGNSIRVGNMYTLVTPKYQIRSHIIDILPCKEN